MSDPKIDEIAAEIDRSRLADTPGTYAHWCRRLLAMVRERDEELIAASDHMDECNKACESASDTIQSLQSQLSARDAQIAERDKPCIWKPYFVKDRLMNYTSGCGMVTLEQAGSFCPYCGRKIEEAKA